MQWLESSKFNLAPGVAEIWQEELLEQTSISAEQALRSVEISTLPLYEEGTSV